MVDYIFVDHFKIQDKTNYCVIEIKPAEDNTNQTFLLRFSINSEAYV